MKRPQIIVLPASLIPFTGKLAAQAPAQVTLVKAARLLDPWTGKVLSTAAVLIEGDRIKQVGPPSQVQGMRRKALRPSIWALRRSFLRIKRARWVPHGPNQKRVEHPL